MPPVRDLDSDDEDEPCAPEDGAELVETDDELDLDIDVEEEDLLQ